MTKEEPKHLKKKAVSVLGRNVARIKGKKLGTLAIVECDGVTAVIDFPDDVTIKEVETAARRTFDALGIGGS